MSSHRTRGPPPLAPLPVRGTTPRTTPRPVSRTPNNTVNPQGEYIYGRPISATTGTPVTSTPRFPRSTNRSASRSAIATQAFASPYMSRTSPFHPLPRGISTLNITGMRAEQQATFSMDANMYDKKQRKVMEAEQHQANLSTLFNARGDAVDEAQREVDKHQLKIDRLEDELKAAIAEQEENKQVVKDRIAQQMEVVDHGAFEAAEKHVAITYDEVSDHLLKMHRDYPNIDVNAFLFEVDGALQTEANIEPKDFSQCRTSREARVHLKLVTQAQVQALDTEGLKAVNKKMRGEEDLNYGGEKPLGEWPQCYGQSRPYKNHIVNNYGFSDDRNDPENNPLFVTYFGNKKKAFLFQTGRGKHPVTRKNMGIDFRKQRLALQLEVPLEENPIDPDMPADAREEYDRRYEAQLLDAASQTSGGVALDDGDESEQDRSDASSESGNSDFEE